MKKNFMETVASMQNPKQSWEEEFAPLIEYVKVNFLDPHPKLLTIERLEQLYSNFEMWSEKLVLDKTENGITFKNYINDRMLIIARRIQRFKQNEHTLNNNKLQTTMDSNSFKFNWQFTERDGKTYLKLSDREVEVTKETLTTFKDSAVILENLKDLYSLYAPDLKVGETLGKDKENIISNELAYIALERVLDNYILLDEFKNYDKAVLMINKLKSLEEVKKIYCTEVEEKKRIEHNLIKLDDIEQNLKYKYDTHDRKINISTRVRAVFNFIEYLHSNIDFFNLQETLYSEIKRIIADKSTLGTSRLDTIKRDELNKKLESINSEIKEKIYNPIESKLIELNIKDPTINSSIWNLNRFGLRYLKDNLNSENNIEITKYESTYRYIQTFNVFPYIKSIIGELEDILFNTIFENISPNTNSEITEEAEVKTTTYDAKELHALKIIKKHFNIIDSQGWNYAFRKEQDYIDFIHSLTKLYSSNTVEIPNRVIEVKSRTKSRIAKTIKDIDKELSSQPILRNYEELFSVLKILKCFSTDTKQSIYSALNR